jgi:8-oxo-dGTP pyrophosphatase MutT (NUDIX family)
MRNVQNEFISSSTTTIKAAGILLYVRSTGMFLALHHIKDSSWGIPAGKSNVSESFFDTALREFQEETGFDGELLTLQTLPKNTVIFPNGSRLVFQTYLAEIETPFDVKIRPDESEAFEWVSSLSEWPQPQQRGIDFLQTNPVCQKIISRMLESHAAPKRFYGFIPK